MENLIKLPDTNNFSMPELCFRAVGGERCVIMKTESVEYCWSWNGSSPTDSQCKYLKMSATNNNLTAVTKTKGWFIKYIYGSAPTIQFYEAGVTLLNAISNGFAGYLKLD
jgi:hypothetical protein